MPKTELKSEKIPVACFAPAMTDEKIKSYEKLISDLPRNMAEVADAMRECMRAVKFWWDLPDSKGSADDAKLKVTHKGKVARVPVVSLTADLIKKMDDYVPWPYEIEAMKKLFDGISDEDREVKTAAMHLLWYAAELSLDREPVTQDKLPK